MKKSLLLAALIVGVVSVVMNPIGAVGDHEPADKASAAANDVDRIGPNGVIPILSQRMRVSSTSDLILQSTAECSILTSVLTEGSGAQGSTSTDGAFGQVESWIEIDGERVPVATNDAVDGTEGEVVFCNRAYRRSITDTENGLDGTDTEDDFIRTRTANGFNWMAFDVGKNYDKPNVPLGTGNNIVEIVQKARYTKVPGECDPAAVGDNPPATLEQTCAEAFVGSRTLIVEAVHASNHEQPDDGLE
jgi:hypothetical protein